MLGAYLNGECVMISQESGEHPFNFMGKLGMTSPLHASAPGKRFSPQCPKEKG